MKRLLLQLVFGLVLGLATRASLPGRQSGGMLLAAVLSLAGAASGSVLANAVLPTDVMRQGGLMLAGLGALAALLIHALLVR